MITIWNIFINVLVWGWVMGQIEEQFFNYHGPDPVPALERLKAILEGQEKIVDQLESMAGRLEGC